MLLLAFGLRGHGQDMHTPTEIMNMIEVSDVAYYLRASDEYVSTFDYTQVNTNFYRQVVTNGELNLEMYDLSHEDSILLIEGDRAFKAVNFVKARDKYHLVYQNNKDFSVIMDYIGHTHALEKNHSKAVEWYIKAIDANYFDYMAHWSLATSYSELGNNELAVREITTAFVLNRNNERLKEALQNIYKAEKLKYQDFEFTPNYRLITSDENPNEVVVAFDEEWMMYGLYKAVWTHEPDYRKTMTGSESTFSLVEERECLTGLLIMNTNRDGKFKKNKKIPALTYLNKANQLDMFKEFVLMEIWLRKYPIIALTQDVETIEKLVDYTLEVRGKKP